MGVSWRDTEWNGCELEGHGMEWGGGTWRMWPKQS